MSHLSKGGPFDKRLVHLSKGWSICQKGGPFVKRCGPFVKGVLEPPFTILLRGNKAAPEGENIFGNGKCELIANFSATMVTSPRRERREV